VAVNIALAGDRNNNYPSHRELDAVRAMLGPGVDSEWVPTDGAQVRDLGGFSGLWLTPGSPYADDAAAYEAIRWARRNDVPFLADAEVIELPANRFFMLTLFQPQIGALAGKPLHPLLHEFVRCARQRAD
jgi:CTP synthase (UTP-ammonia lyase)